jgi:hypothetical protein
MQRHLTNTVQKVNKKKTGRKGRMNEHVENEILILGLILGRERVES